MLQGSINNPTRWTITGERRTSFRFTRAQLRAYNYLRSTCAPHATVSKLQYDWSIARDTIAPG